MSRLSNGERIAGVSAILLLVFMFFHWYGVKAVNTSNLLFAVQAGGPGKSAWEALDYTPVVLVVTIAATLTMVVLRLGNAHHGPFVPINAVVTILGIVSVLLILFRIADPPVFDVERTITTEGAAQSPVFLALFAAAGIATGGRLAMRDEGISLSGLLARQGRGQGRLP